MRSAYPFRKHKNQLQGYSSTIYSICQMIRYKILYKMQLKKIHSRIFYNQKYDSFTIYAFYFEYHWPCSIIAAGNHNAVILCPTMHYTATLKVACNPLELLTVEAKEYLSALKHGMLSVVTYTQHFRLAV